MSKVQHTPGLWGYYPAVTDHGGRFDETNFEVVAEPRGPFERSKPVCTVHGWTEDFDKEALPNALLITAAPDLQAAALDALEALQDAMNALATSDFAFDPSGLEEAHAALFEAVRKSIPAAPERAQTVGER